MKSNSEVVLKNLSQKYEVDPRRLRVILRKQLGNAKGRRWRWKEGSKELKKVEALLCENFSTKRE